jgi:hypothetical protein
MSRQTRSAAAARAPSAGEVGMRLLQSLLATLLATFLVAPSAFSVAPQGRSQKKPDQKQQQAAQPAPEQPPVPPPDDSDKPKSVLTGPVAVKSQRTPRDSASAGYKGVDPDGKVDTAQLNTPPTGDDTNKVLQMSVYVVSQSELDAFIKEGKLKTPPPAGVAR